MRVKRLSIKYRRMSIKRLKMEEKMRLSTDLRSEDERMCRKD
jgi:hypothetical protein